jgi:hypothetical protein
MRRLWVWIALLLFVTGLAGAYAAYWKIVHDRAVALLDAQVEVWRAQGYDVTWSERETGGFPLKVEAVFTRPAASSIAGPSPWSWSGETLRVHLRPWAYQRITLTPEGLNTLASEETGTLDAFAREFSVTLEADAQGVKLVALKGRGAGAVVRATGETFAGAESIDLRAARDSGDPSFYRVTGEATGPAWRYADRGAPETLSLDLEIDRADVLVARGALDEAALSAWAEAGGGLNVRKLDADWGDSGFGAEGELTLDRAGRWNGAIALESRDPARAFFHLAELGAIEPEAAAQAGALAGAMVRDGEDAARLAFNLREGEVRLLGLRLGSVAPAF